MVLLQGRFVVFFMEHFVVLFCGKSVSCVLGRLPKVLYNLFWVTGNRYLIGPWLTLHDGGR